MKIKVTEANANTLLQLFEHDYEIYINDNAIDYIYVSDGEMIVEIEGYDRNIDFGEEIDVRVVQVIRNEVEVSFEG